MRTKNEENHHLSIFLDKEIIVQRHPRFFESEESLSGTKCALKHHAAEIPLPIQFLVELQMTSSEKFLLSNFQSIANVPF